jgi:hypothetical protein
MALRRDLFLRSLRYASVNCNCSGAQRLTLLQEAITNDEGLGWQDIEPGAFDGRGKRTLTDLCDTLQEVKQVSTNARTCSELG